MSQHGLDGLDVHEKLSLVVAGSSCEQSTFRVDGGGADGGFKRRRFPQFQRIRRLDVVMAVHQNGGQSFAGQVFGVHHRVTGGGANFHTGQADFLQMVRHHLRGLVHRIGISGVGAHTGKAQQFFEFVGKSVKVGV